MKFSCIKTGDSEVQATVLLQLQITLIDVHKLNQIVYRFLQRLWSINVYSSSDF